MTGFLGVVGIDIKKGLLISREDTDNTKNNTKKMYCIQRVLVLCGLCNKREGCFYRGEERL